MFIYGDTMVLARVISELLGNYIGGVAQRRFNTLEEALAHLFWWEEGFEIKKEGNNVLSQGSCPIYKYYPRWCDESCLSFIEKIAEKFGFKVERSERQPQSDKCVFVFTK